MNLAEKFIEIERLMRDKNHESPYFAPTQSGEMTGTRMTFIVSDNSSTTKTEFSHHAKLASDIRLA